MNRRFAIAGLGLLITGGTVSASPARAATLEALPRPEFQPSRGETVTIPVRLPSSCRLRVDIFTGDGDLVRSLADRQPRKPGRHGVVWDGRDSAGELVPDEAYHPVLSCRTAAGETVRADPRRNTGGWPLGSLKPVLSSDGTISVDLESPSRLLVRLGMKGGAMMRAVEAWTPRAAGRTRIKWDGYDASGVDRILGKEGLTVLVTGFSLPDGTIITSGNEKASYPAYRLRRGWGTPAVKPEEVKTERAGRRLSRQSQLPVSLLREPRVSITIAENASARSDGAFLAKGPITFRVNVPPEDRWLLQQSLYEVSFFLDQQFVSEEETGYTPLSWRWDPVGVSPGRHVMTVNLSGFWGQVGVASIPIWVDGKPTTGRGGQR